MGGLRGSIFSLADSFFIFFLFVIFVVNVTLRLAVCCIYFIFLILVLVGGIEEFMW